jgi:hypothetical protein
MIEQSNVVDVPRGHSCLAGALYLSRVGSIDLLDGRAATSRSGLLQYPGHACLPTRA